jgi:UTP--glucose-1-phosphate uridylyltransferase
MLQWVVEEAVASGIQQICIVIREGKELIRDYFLERQPESRKRDESVEALERLVAACRLTFAYQRRPLGLGDALLAARDFVGSSPFVLMVPDQLMMADVQATAQLLRQWKPGAAIWSSLLRLPKEERAFFAGARGIEFEPVEGEAYLRMGRVQTEEETVDAYRELPFEVRGFGRTIYPPEIFDYLGPDYVNPRTGEVDLLKTFEKCTERIAHHGVMLEGRAFDLGTFDGYYRYLPQLWESNH